MTQAMRRWPVPRFTLGRLMTIVAVFAGSFAIFGALSRAFARINLPIAIGLVVLYDLMIYFVIQAIRKLVVPPERPSLGLVVVAVLVLASCAGLPLLILAEAFLGLPVQ